MGIDSKRVHCAICNRGTMHQIVRQLNTGAVRLTAITKVICADQVRESKVVFTIQAACLQYRLSTYFFGCARKWRFGSANFHVVTSKCVILGPRAPNGCMATEAKGREAKCYRQSNLTKYFQREGFSHLHVLLTHTKSSGLPEGTSHALHARWSGLAKGGLSIIARQSNQIKAKTN